MTTLSSVAVGRDNNLNLLRFCAASMVILGHAYPLTRAPGATDPLGRFGLGFGGLGVCIFFVISGFLISQSFERRRSSASFWRARVLRIWPGLLVSSLFTAFVVGSLATNLPRSAYLADPDTWLYPLRAMLLRPLADGLFLPGVFERNPFPRLPNGSVWTLYYEVLCYGLVAVVGLLAPLVRAPKLPLVLVAAVAIFVLYGLSPPALAIELKPPLSYYVAFLCGMVAYEGRDRLPLARRWLAASGAAILLFSGLAYFKVPLADVFIIVPVAYVVLYVAFWPRLYVRAFNEVGDYSYGIYVYAFPIQQLLSMWIPGIYALTNAALAFVMTLVPAVLSWHFVEKPSLALKSAPARVYRDARV
ncbi:MAG: acyltransferase [Alsobacter sp.]